MVNSFLYYFLTIRRMNICNFEALFKSNMYLLHCKLPIQQATMKASYHYHFNLHASVYKIIF